MNSAPVDAIPPGLEDGADKPAARGFVDGSWYTEETAGAVRQAIRVGQLLHQETTPYQRIAVYDTAFFGKMLTLDGLLMLTERDEFVYHEMLVHVPLCSLEGPKRVLIVGGGDCGCLREVLKHDSVVEAIQVDIDERVTAVARSHFPWVRICEADPRAKLIFDDGLEFIRNNPSAFDLVVIDSTDPRGFALGLFLSEFYATVARSLTDRGIMSAQTESPHWDAPMVGAIYGQIRRAFPHVAPYLASVPSYASGLWTLAHASKEPRGPCNTLRAHRLGKSCRYYNEHIHEACFALPGFVRAAIEGQSPFSRFDERFTQGPDS